MARWWPGTNLQSRAGDDGCPKSPRRQGRNTVAELTSPRITLLFSTVSVIIIIPLFSIYFVMHCPKHLEYIHWFPDKVTRGLARWSNILAVALSVQGRPVIWNKPNFLETHTFLARVPFRMCYPTQFKSCIYNNHRFPCPENFCLWILVPLSGFQKETWS